ncbi:MAG: hypothetical protein SFZ03_04295 [Candidatus Melainabacteria bacterium]|nr:hypothetical protein [Candidatus Melainabacteria bacterium]
MSIENHPLLEILKPLIEPGEITFISESPSRQLFVFKTRSGETFALPSQVPNNLTLDILAKYGPSQLQKAYNNVFHTSLQGKTPAEYYAYSLKPQHDPTLAAQQQSANWTQIAAVVSIGVLLFQIYTHLDNKISQANEKAVEALTLKKLLENQIELRQTAPALRYEVKRSAPIRSVKPSPSNAGN